MSNDNSITGSIKSDENGSIDREVDVPVVDQDAKKEGINLLDYFSDVQVVHLEKFPKRWQKFEERTKAAGVRGYKKFKAVLGDNANPPVWWRAGNGA